MLIIFKVGVVCSICKIYVRTLSERSELFLTTEWSYARVMSVAHTFSAMCINKIKAKRTYRQWVCNVKFDRNIIIV